MGVLVYVSVRVCVGVCYENVSLFRLRSKKIQDETDALFFTPRVSSTRTYEYKVFQMIVVGKRYVIYIYTLKREK